MFGITIGIDPIAFEIGSLEVRWYSIAILVAIIVAVALAVREGRRNGVPAEEIYSLAPWLILGGVVGARAFHIVDRWQYYLANPLQTIMLQQGGLAIWGAVAGGVLALWIYGRVRHISWLLLADTLVVPLLAAQMVGRLGCIVNGDSVGSEVYLPWAFVYTHPAALVPANLFDVPTHPYPVYEILWNGAVLAVLLSVRRKWLAGDGSLFTAYIGLYALGRFILSYFRVERVWLWGLQEAQVLALLTLAGALVIAFYILRRRREPPPPTASDDEVPPTDDDEADGEESSPSP